MMRRERITSGRAGHADEYLRSALGSHEPRLLRRCSSPDVVSSIRRRFIQSAASWRSSAFQGTGHPALTRNDAAQRADLGAYRASSSVQSQSDGLVAAPVIHLVAAPVIHLQAPTPERAATTASAAHGAADRSCAALLARTKDHRLIPLMQTRSMKVNEDRRGRSETLSRPLRILRGWHGCCTLLLHSRGKP
jgi:hypothetical protein